MKTLTLLFSRLAFLGVAALSVFFAVRAARMFYGVANHRVADDMLFRVVICCDIPSASIIQNALSTGIALTIGAGLGAVFSLGIWRFKRWAHVGALAWCAFIAFVQWKITEDLIPVAKSEHFALVYYCLGVMAFLCLSWVLSPIASTISIHTPSHSEAPISSPHE